MGFGGWRGSQGGSARRSCQLCGITIIDGSWSRLGGYRGDAFGVTVSNKVEYIVETS